MKYLFGPVPSRRLGISLGVDVLREKTCTFDCVYCEVGRTTQRTLRRCDYVPKGEVLRELHGYLSSNGTGRGLPEVITFSGSGEPTLHARLGEMIAGVKDMTSIPVAVITNSSLLYLPDVRDDVMEADIVLPSLDAVSDKVFRKLNRPEATMKVDLILSGLHLLRQEYRGQMWLEILIVAGYNDSEQELEGLATVARELHVDRVQIHTASRPSPENEVEPASPEVLRHLADTIGSNAQVVGDIASPQPGTVSGGDLTLQVLNVVRKRPGRVKDVSVITGADGDRVAKVLDALTEAGRIRKIVHQDDDYFIGM